MSRNGRTGAGLRTQPIDRIQSPPQEGALLPGPGSLVGGARALGLAPVLAVPAPDLFKPPEGTFFQRYVEATIGPGPVVVRELIAGAVGVARGTSLLELPTNTVGVIREITFGVIAMNAGTIIDFFLRVSGSPIEGFAPLSVFPGAIIRFSSTFPPESTMVDLPDGKESVFAVSVLDAGTYQLSVQYRGWFYPKELRTEYIDMIRGGRTPADAV